MRMTSLGSSSIVILNVKFLQDLAIVQKEYQLCLDYCFHPLLITHGNSSVDVFHPKMRLNLRYNTIFSSIPRNWDIAVNFCNTKTHLKLPPLSWYPSDTRDLSSHLVPISQVERSAIRGMDLYQNQIMKNGLNGLMSTQFARELLITTEQTLHIFSQLWRDYSDYFSQFQSTFLHQIHLRFLRDHTVKQALIWNHLRSRKYIQKLASLHHWSLKRCRVLNELLMTRWTVSAGTFRTLIPTERFQQALPLTLADLGLLTFTWTTSSPMLSHFMVRVLQMKGSFVQYSRHGKGNLPSQCTLSIIPPNFFKCYESLSMQDIANNYREEDDSLPWYRLDTKSYTPSLLKQEKYSLMFHPTSPQVKSQVRLLTTEHLCKPRGTPRVLLTPLTSRDLTGAWIQPSSIILRQRSYRDTVITPSLISVLDLVMRHTPTPKTGHAMKGFRLQSRGYGLLRIKVQ
uniref:Uncharacterized protein n=1 Tax=Beihai reo-like virus 1 TaxID=1922649 RepID=A0A1L3KP59_9VIRU|nr:hypothetical protein 1 [Beihai reo-like virus 1]